MDNSPVGEQKSEIAVIIINYNSSEFTVKCVARVIENTPISLPYKIIIVDNASRKEDFQELRTYVSALKNNKVSLYRSRINSGFGGGNMFGVQQASADYYLFLNNDTLLKNDAISICHKFMESTPDAAICGAQIYNESEEREVSFDHFTSFAREVFGKRALEAFYPGKPNRRKIYDGPLLVDYVNGSFMFCRATDFNDVGGFDTNLFLFFEESDICHRLKKKGRRTYFLPAASYLHFQGKSIDKIGMPIATKIELKTSMFYVIRKNYGYLHYQILRLFFIIRYGLVSLVKPKYFTLFHRILIGLPLGKSLKQKQQIQD